VKRASDPGTSLTEGRDGPFAAGLKVELAQRHEGRTLPSHKAYPISKSGFVEAVVGEALRRGLPVPARSDG
jgi:hypothetical protein